MTHQAISKAIQDGLNRGEDSIQVAMRLKKIYSGPDTFRVIRISRRELDAVRDSFRPPAPSSPLKGIQLDRRGLELFLATFGKEIDDDPR